MTKAEERFEEWKRRDADDELSVRAILKEEDGAPSTVCFLSQQIAEKYLKGFLVFSKEKFEKTHQLDHLLKLCEAIDSSFHDPSEDVTFLTEYYIEARYPGDIPEFNWNEARKAFAHAQNVKMFVLERIK